MLPADFALQGHGSICLLQPLTAEGRAWVDEHLVNEETWFWGTSVAVEPGHIEGLLNEIVGDGLCCRPLCPEEHPVNCRAVLTYHPAIGTFRGMRGAWRVSRCYPLPLGFPARIYSRDGQLFMDVPRRLHPGTFVNPTKLLRELLAKRRLSSPQPKELAA